MPTLYIMCGLAFAGKSTLARRIAKHTNSKLIAFDTLWIDKEKIRPISKGAEGWRFIRKTAQDQTIENLKEGVSVVYDDTNVRFEHREELRKIAKRLNAKDVVVYLNTPIELIRKRELRNKITAERHEVEQKNFQTALEQLEIPTLEENVVEFRPETKIDDLLQDLGKTVEGRV